MGTIAQKLESVNNSKEAIKTAIEAKGVVVGDSPLKDYAGKIGSISGGGSSFDEFVDSKGYQKYREQAEGWLRRSYEITGDLKEFKYGQFLSNEIIITIPDGTILQNTKTLENCFGGWSQIQYLDLSNWDVSNVTTLSSCFNGCSSIKYLDLSNWDVSNVTTLSSCWGNCSSIKYLDLSNWDVSNVTTLFASFYGCKLLEALNMSNWDATNITNTTSTFYGCSKLKNLICFKNIKISFSLTGSNLLTRESLLSVLEAPAQVTTTQTLSLHATTKALITTAQANVSAGTADELDTQIANEVTNVINKGWTIA